MRAVGADSARTRIIIAVMIALATACGLSVQGTDTAPIVTPDAGTPDTGTDVHPNLFTDTGSTVDGSPSGPTCPGIHGPETVLVTYDGGAFCIDATEVTRADYAAFVSFVATNGGPDASAILGCEPPDGGLDAGGIRPVNDDAGDGAAYEGPYFPVFGVSYCDAAMYCAWAGKRLCGALSDGANYAAPDGGMDAGLDLTSDEWGYACSNGGATLYPYGNDAGNACDDTPTGSLHEAGALPLCAGGASSSLFDMSKNVFEWEHACSGADNAPQDTCVFRGGDSNSPPAESSCAVRANANAQRVGPPTMMHVGIRCCGTPLP